MKSYPAGDEVSEVLQDGEGSEDHPVGQPLSVVALLLGLQGLDGAVGGVGKPDNNINDAPNVTINVITLPDHVGKKLSSKSKSKPRSYQTNHSISNV